MPHLDWRPGALEELADSPAVEEALEVVAAKIMRDARRTVKAVYPGTWRWRAINTEAGRDAESAFVDVGYTKTHYGFVLWWSEVGTANTPARPHLRAALDRAR